MGLTQVSSDGVKNDAISHNKIPANAIQASELADNAVDTAAIAADAVTTAKIADNNVTEAKLSLNAVTNNRVANGSITNAKIGNGAIDTAKLQDDAVTNAKVADDAIGVAQLSASGTASNSTFLRGDNSWTTVNTDLVSDTSPQLGGDLQSNGNDIDFADSDKATFGTDVDLEIYHTGSDGVIYNKTGNLYLYGDGDDIFINATNAKINLWAKPDGAVELRHDNSKKFETTSTGVSVTGNVIAAGNLDSTTNGGRVSVGDNADLYMTHTNNGLIDCNTGNLDIVTQNTLSLKNADSENAVVCNKHGSVDLYYDNSKKFETTSTGAIVTGLLTTTKLISNQSSGSAGLGFSDNVQIHLGTSDDLKIYHGGSNAYISNSTGSLFVTGNTIKLRNGDANEDFIECFDNGSVRLYHNNNLKLETASGGVTVTGTCTATAFSGDGSGLTGISAIPAGMVAPFGQTSAPSGWLACNGAAVSRSGYSALFSAIGTVYGAGDGSSTFNLPELRGEFIRGLDNGRGVDSGRNNGSFQDHGIPAMKGHVSDAHGNSRINTWATSGYTNVFTGTGSSSWRTSIHSASGNYASLEFDSTNIIPDATHVRPRNVAMTYFIKV